MRIGIDVRNLQERNWSGIGAYTYHLIDALLHHSEHNYILFSNTRAASKSYFIHERVSDVHTRFPNIFFHPALRFLGRPFLDKLIEKESGKKIDLFFSPNLHFTSVSKHIPHVLTIHDLSFELYKECYSLKRQLWHTLVQPQKQCERARAIIVPSEHTKEDVVRLFHIDQKKIHVIYPGIPFAEKTLSDKQVVPESYILFLGTVEPRKNIEGMLLAYAQSKLFSEGVHFVIAGSVGWKSERLMRLLRETPGVQYLNYVDEKEKMALYTHAKAFLFPSFYEGFGFPVVEAMAAGVPVLTSDRSSLPEIAQGAAYLVNPYSIGAIAAGMQLLVHDQALREKLQGDGRRVIARYDWKQAAVQLDRVFQLVV